MTVNHLCCNLQRLENALICIICCLPGKSYFWKNTNKVLLGENSLFPAQPFSVFIHYDIVIVVFVSFRPKSAYSGNIQERRSRRTNGRTGKYVSNHEKIIWTTKKKKKRYQNFYLILSIVSHLCFLCPCVFLFHNITCFCFV